MSRAMSNSKFERPSSWGMMGRDGEGSDLDLNMQGRTCRRGRRSVCSWLLSSVRLQDRNTPRSQ